MKNFEYGDVVRLDERAFISHLVPKYGRGFSDFEEYKHYEHLFKLYGKVIAGDIHIKDYCYEITNYDWIHWWTSNQYDSQLPWIKYSLVEFDGKLFVFPDKVLLKMPSTNLYRGFLDKKFREKLLLYEHTIPSRTETINVLTEDGVVRYGLIKYLLSIIEELEKCPPTTQLAWEIEKLNSEKKRLQDEISFMKKTIKTIKNEWNKL